MPPQLRSWLLLALLPPGFKLKRTLSTLQRLLTSKPDIWSSPPQSTLRALCEQQRQTNRQLEQVTSLLQHTLLPKASTTPEGAVGPPVSQQLPPGRDITPHNPKKFSGESLVEQAQIEVEILQTPLQVQALDGRMLHRITHRTKNLELVLSVCSLS
ncbi:hypothetical protein AMECASPLE_027399 [Ameca splendens]|uniref:Uncharacterized protein n=1 Tax=Ameca splendens TaxID=208324 RepID=A0ABV0YSW0_9TELE